MNIIALFAYIFVLIYEIPYVGQTLIFLVGLVSCLTIFKTIKYMFAD